MIVRRRDGSFNLALTPDERALLAGLVDQLEDLIDAGPDDPLARRLFPVAYPDDEKREAEYRLLAGEELRRPGERPSTLMRSTAEASRPDRGPGQRVAAVHQRAPPRARHPARHAGRRRRR